MFPLFSHSIIARKALADQLYQPQNLRLRDSSFSLLGPLCSSLLGRSVGVAVGEDWKRQRRCLSEGFGPLAVKQQAQLIQDMIVRWLPSHDVATAAPTTFTLTGAGLDKLPLLIIARLVYGSDLSAEDEEEIVSLGELHQELMNAAGSPLTKLPFFLTLPSRTKRIHQEFLQRWRALHRKFVARYQSDEQHETIFSMVMRKLNKEQQGNGLSSEEV